MTACPAHPEAEAVATCERCGRFFCAAEEITLDLHRYCGECGRRTDVDWLGHHYAPLIGKRSSFSWWAGLFAAGSAALAIAVFVGGEPRQKSLAAGFALESIALFSFFGGERWGRFAPLAVSPLVGVGFAFAAVEDFFWPVFVVVTLVAALYGAAGITDLRSKLYFRVEVPRGALRKHFERYGNNPLAITASRLAFFSLFVPGLGVISFFLGVWALTRIDSKATPPVTNAGAAIGAMIFSVFTSLIWAASLLTANRV
ncbi:MAG: hypothetical protein QM817_22855 [Archangium sp.]